MYNLSIPSTFKAWLDHAIVGQDVAARVRALKPLSVRRRFESQLTGLAGRPE